MTWQRIAVKEKKEIVAWQNIVGLQILSMASLNFGDSRENFGREKILCTRNDFL